MKELGVYGHRKEVQGGCKCVERVGMETEVDMDIKETGTIVNFS